MLNVCHITSGHDYQDTRIFKRECATLRNAGYNVTLLAQAEETFVQDGIVVFSLPRLGVRWYSRLFLLFPILKVVLTRNEDVFHFHDPDLLTIMLFASILRGKPVVWDAHEHYESVISHNNKLGSHYLSLIAGKAFGFIELTFCKLAKATVVTVSETMAERYRNHGIAAIACANYVDKRKVPFPPALKRTTPPLIIMSGSIQTVFSPMDLLEAFILVRKNRACKLAFWGVMAGELRIDLLRRAAEAGLEDSVECAGPFTWEKLVTELIPTASIGVLISNPAVSSQRSAAPNRIFEYWVNGVPALVSNGTFYGDLVREVNGGLTVPYGDIEGIARGLEKLLSDRNTLENYGQNGRRAVVERFNWEQEGLKLLDLYEQILQSAQPSLEISEKHAK